MKGERGEGRESEGITAGGMQNRQGGFMVCIYNLEFTIAITAAFDNTSSTWKPIPAHPHFLTHHVLVNVHVRVRFYLRAADFIDHVWWECHCWTPQ